MDKETLAAVQRDIIRNEGVAKSDEVQKAQWLCEKNNDRIDKLENHIADMERRMEQKLKSAQEDFGRKLNGAGSEEKRPKRMRTGGRSSTSCT